MRTWFDLLRYDAKRRVPERIVHFAARKMPRKLRYWAVIVAACEAAGDHRSPAEVTSLEMLKVTC